MTRQPLFGSNHCRQFPIIFLILIIIVGCVPREWPVAPTNPSLKNTPFQSQPATLPASTLVHPQTASTITQTVVVPTPYPDCRDIALMTRGIDETMFVYEAFVLHGFRRYDIAMSPQTFLGWRDEGCTVLLGYLFTGDIDKVDIRTAKRKDFIDFKELIQGIIPFDNLTRVPLISPDEQWLLFFRGSGESTPTMDHVLFEYNDIISLSIDGETGPFALSKGGGATLAAWSHFDETIAFNDLDAQKNTQLFVASVDGAEIESLTHFSEPYKFFKIIWSPDDAYLVSQVEAPNLKRFAIITRVSGRSEPIVVGDWIPQWWINESTILFTQKEKLSNTSEKTKFTTMDVKTGKIGDISTFPIAGNSFSFTNNGSKTKLLIVVAFSETASDTIYRYDLETGEYEEIFSFSIDGMPGLLINSTEQ